MKSLIQYITETKNTQYKQCVKEWIDFIIARTQNDAPYGPSLLCTVERSKYPTFYYWFDRNYDGDIQLDKDTNEKFLSYELDIKKEKVLNFKFLFYIDDKKSPIEKTFDQMFYNYKEKLDKLWNVLHKL